MGASEAEVRTLHCRKHGAPTMRFSGLCVRPDDVLARLPVRDDNGDVVISEKLRQTSLLGSSTFMRILASAYDALITSLDRDQGTSDGHVAEGIVGAAATAAARGGVARLPNGANVRSVFVDERYWTVAVSVQLTTGMLVCASSNRANVGTCGNWSPARAREE